MKTPLVRSLRLLLVAGAMLPIPSLLGDTYEECAASYSYCTGHCTNAIGHPYCCENNCYACIYLTCQCQGGTMLPAD